MGNVDHAAIRNKRFPTKPIKNYDRLKNHVRREFDSAAEVHYEKVTLSIRTSNSPIENQTYAREMYGNGVNCICQMCCEPTQYPEVVEPVNCGRELKQLHLCLCPECARIFKLFRGKRGDFFSKLFRHAVLASDVSEPKSVYAVKLNDAITIRFTQTHLAEVREIFKLLDAPTEPKSAPKRKDDELLELARAALSKNDERSAIKHCVEATKLGNTKAMIMLGDICRKRNDLPKAIAWYSNAAKRGDSEAKEILERIQHQSEPKPSTQLKMQLGEHTLNFDKALIDAIDAIRALDAAVKKAVDNFKAFYDSADATGIPIARKESFGLEQLKSVADCVIKFSNALGETDVAARLLIDSAPSQLFKDGASPFDIWHRDTMRKHHSEHVEGLKAAAEQIEFRALTVLGVNNFKQRREKCNALMKKLFNREFEGAAMQQAAASAFVLNPFDLRAYRFYFENFGDSNGELRQLAKLFKMDADLATECSDIARSLFQNAETSSLTRIASFRHCGEEFSTFIVADGVKTIGRYAFANCKKLKHVHLPSTLETIEVGAFCDCINLDDINLPESLRSIEKDAFKNCDWLPEIDIPNGVKQLSIEFTNQVRQRSVVKKQMRRVWLPSTIEKFTGDFRAVEKDILFDCDISRGNFVLRTLRDNDMLDRVPDLKTQSLRERRVVKVRGFANHPEVSGVKFNDRLKIVRDEAFFGCGNLESVLIPYGTEELGSRMFAGCFNLKFVSIPDTVRVIGDGLMEGCSATVYCSPDSPIGKYCREHDIPMRDEGATTLNEARRLLENFSNKEYSKEAYELLTTAARYGNLDAMFETAMCLADGIGTRKNPIRAMFTLNRAAKLGNVRSMLQLHIMYRDGAVGVKPNPEAAAYWFELSGAEVAPKKSPTLGSEKKSLKEMIQHWYNMSGSLRKVHFAGFGDKAEKKIKAAIKAYAADAASEHAIFVFDNTVFGGADEGILVTDKKIYSRGWLAGAFCIPIDKIESISYTKDGDLLHLTVNGKQTSAFYGSDKRLEMNALKDLLEDITGKLT